MLKSYQFKTHCNGHIHSSKIANIILPGLPREYRWTLRPYPCKRSSIQTRWLIMSCFNQQPWMHLNLNTILYT